MSSSAPAKRRASLNDVARRAKVSPGTVSRGLDPTKCHLLAAETRERVQRVAMEIGFEPNRTAKRLRQGKTGIITLVSISQTHSSFFGGFTLGWGEMSEQIFRGILNEAIRFGYNINTLYIREDNHEAVFEKIGPRFSDGTLILGWPQLKSFQEQVTRAGIPCVLLSTNEVDMPEGSPSYDPTPLVYRRYLGYRDALLNAGCFDNARVVGFRDRVEMHRYLRKTPELPFDAVLCSNDETAASFIEVATVAGLRVPEDLRVIGYDNLPIPLFDGRRLSTVAVPRSELGRQAMTDLARQIDSNESASTKKVLTTEYLEGNTG